VDPARDFAFLVSIPRDLWLPQPSGLTNRVNTAMFNGYDPTDAHAGPRYLAKTIEDNFGVPTSGYFVVNFAGFVDIIDAAGGITVDVPVLLEDNAYPTENFGTMSVRFEPGRQKMDGERALIYVRTRHQDSDFGRAARQQQVLGALARRLLAPSGWPRIPGVLAATLRAVQTDVSLLQVPALARFAVYVATNRSETAVLGREYTEPWTTETGAAVLLPNWDAIHRLFQQLFP
jgi:LCP family protein required for cell wall assembly